MTVKPKNSTSSYVLRQYICPIVVLCSSVCLTTVARAQSLPTDNFALTKSTTGWASGTTAPNPAPRLELSMAESSSFGSWVTPPDESRRPSNAPGLLISMIDRKAPSAGTHSEKVSVAAKTKSSSEFDLYKAIVAEQRNSQPGFLSSADLKGMAINPTDRSLFSSNASLEVGATTSEDQAEPHVKPLAQVHIGDYGLPVFLHVTDAQECCR
jgi:hypothetical protein